MNKATDVWAQVEVLAAAATMSEWDRVQAAARFLPDGWAIKQVGARCPYRDDTGCLYHTGGHHG